jgi:diguanylate cyclase (GGDEF)-like protein
VIIAVAGILKEITRPGDIAARLAGDEFAVLLPDTDGKDALRLAEHIRENVMNLSIQVPKAPGSEETIEIGIRTSLGVAVAPTHGENERNLVFAADNALRRAKEAGRNRVEMVK